MYELELFAGCGGGIIGSELLGIETVGAVEIEKYPRERLLDRQKDGLLSKFPVWDDVSTFRLDNPDCREYIQWLISIRHWLIVSGGFPCQDISVAGKGAGIHGKKSSLFFELARIIGEIRPRYIFLENSPAICGAKEVDLRLVEVAADLFGNERRVRACRMRLEANLAPVLGKLSEIGYDAVWNIVSAAEVGALHRRERWWLWGEKNTDPDNDGHLHRKHEVNSTKRKQHA